MIKKLAMLAAAAVLYIAAPAAPASAQGISVQIGNGGGYHGGHRGYHRGPGYRNRAYMGRDYGRRHHGWDRRGPRGKTIIVR